MTNIENKLAEISGQIHAEILEFLMFCSREDLLEIARLALGDSNPLVLDYEELESRFDELC